MTEKADDAKRMFDKTLDLLRSATSEVKEGLKRTYDEGMLRHEVKGVKGSLDDVTRELGRKALETLRAGGQLTSEAVAPLLRRIDDLEDQIATKERQLAELAKDTPPG
jgi:transposase